MFNGQAQIPGVLDGCDIRLDATGDGGLGIFIDGAFLGLSPAETRTHWACVDHPCTPWANHWELYNFVVLLRVYSDYVRNKVILIDNDNMAAIAAVRKFAASSAEAVETARILRLLFGLCVQLNVRLRARWVPGALNVLLDALSRQYWGVTAAELHAYRCEQGFRSRSPYLECMAKW